MIARRHLLVLGTFLLAMLLYVDRICISTAKEPITADLKLSDTRVRLGACRPSPWATPCVQTPAGMLADRFGPRLILAAVVTLWSVVHRADRCGHRPGGAARRAVPVRRGRGGGLSRHGAGHLLLDPDARARHRSGDQLLRRAAGRGVRAARRGGDGRGARLAASFRRPDAGRLRLGGRSGSSGFATIRPSTPASATTSAKLILTTRQQAMPAAEACGRSPPAALLAFRQHVAPDAAILLQQLHVLLLPDLAVSAPEEDLPARCRDRRLVCRGPVPGRCSGQPLSPAGWSIASTAAAAGSSRGCPGRRSALCSPPADWSPASSWTSAGRGGRLAVRRRLRRRHDAQPLVGGLRRYRPARTPARSRAR